MSKVTNFLKKYEKLFMQKEPLSAYKSSDEYEYSSMLPSIIVEMYDPETDQFMCMDIDINRFIYYKSITEKKYSETLDAVLFFDLSKKEIIQYAVSQLRKGLSSLKGYVYNDYCSLNAFEKLDLIIALSENSTIASMSITRSYFVFLDIFDPKLRMIKSKSAEEIKRAVLVEKNKEIFIVELQRTKYYYGDVNFCFKK